MERAFVKDLLQCYVKERTSVDVKLSEDAECDQPSASNSSLLYSVFQASLAIFKAFPAPEGLKASHFCSPNLGFDSSECHASNVPQSPVPQQRIRVFAQGLIAEAHRIELNHQPLHGEQFMLQGLNQEERTLMHNIRSISRSGSVTAIGECLKRSVTKRTMLSTLQFLRNVTTSFTQELTMACELASIILPSIQSLLQRISISNVICEYLENRSELTEILELLHEAED